MSEYEGMDLDELFELDGAVMPRPVTNREVIVAGMENSIEGWRQVRALPDSYWEAFGADPAAERASCDEHIAEELAELAKVRAA